AFVAEDRRFAAGDGFAHRADASFEIDQVAGGVDHRELLDDLHAETILERLPGMWWAAGRQAHSHRVVAIVGALLLFEQDRDDRAHVIELDRFEIADLGPET